MSTLAVTNTFVAAAVITAASHNQNYSDIVSWANGGIADDNLDTFTGAVVWSVTSNSLAVDITNTGNQGSMSIAQSAALASGKSVLKISNTANQASAAAIVDIVSSHASSVVPTLKITDSGAGPGLAVEVVSTTRGALPAPKMTTTQRDAIASPVEGTEIWNTTLKRKEVYDGSFWVSASGLSGQVIDWPGAGTLPTYLVECDGSTLANNGTNAKARDVLSTTWGSAGVLPDLRGRTTIGVGTGSGLTARTIADNVGAETLPAHTHSITDPGHRHKLLVNAAANQNPAGDGPGSGISVNQAGLTSGQLAGSNADAGRTDSSSQSTGITATQSTGTGSHGVMQPSTAMRKCMVL